MQRHSSALRHTLQGAINSRLASLRNNRCRRTDHDEIRASIGRAQVFLNSYPNATDERVKAWCEAHVLDIGRIVPGNQPRVLAKLVFDKLKAVQTSGNDIVQLTTT